MPLILFVHGAGQMQYAPAAHWDHVFRTLGQANDDLDWGEQWVGACAPILHTHQMCLARRGTRLIF
jgi:hypothetical protein